MSWKDMIPKSLLDDERQRCECRIGELEDQLKIEEEATEAAERERDEAIEQLQDHRQAWKARAEAAEQKRDEAKADARNGWDAYEDVIHGATKDRLTLAAVREKFEALRNGPDTLTQAGLQIVNEALAILDGKGKK